MEAGKTYVLSEGNNLLEGMTKEQIIAAIAEATGETPTHVDDAFITKLKEQNRNKALKVWVGTQYEYNAIGTPASDTLYIITDVDEYEERLQAIETELDNLAVYSTEETQIGTWVDGKPLYRKVFTGTMPTITDGTYTNVNIDVSGIPFDMVTRIEGVVQSNNGYIPFPYNSAANYETKAFITNNSERLTIRTALGDLSAKPYIVILEYTKA